MLDLEADSMKKALSAVLTAIILAVSVITPFSAMSESGNDLTKTGE